MRTLRPDASKAGRPNTPRRPRSAGSSQKDLDAPILKELAPTAPCPQSHADSQPWAGSQAFLWTPRDIYFYIFQSHPVTSIASSQAPGTRKKPDSQPGEFGLHFLGPALHQGTEMGAISLSGMQFSLSVLSLGQREFYQRIN